MSVDDRPIASRPNVQETQAWLNAHHGSGHGVPRIEPIPHPDGNWRRLVCPLCGSTHLTIVDEPEQANG